MTKSRDIACIDLFCGAGGLTHGLVEEGIDVIAGIDVDEDCRHPYTVNNPAGFINADVARLTTGRIRNLFGDARIRILAGCAPCQPFSTYSQRYETVGTPRWELLRHFARLVCFTLPDLVTMENVPMVARHEVFDDFMRTLKRMGYHVWAEAVDCTEYGLPQTRRRMVILASLHGPIEMIPKTHTEVMTVRDAIGRLCPIPQGGASGVDPLHTASKLSPLNLERIRASVPGGTWRDWPDRLVAACHLRETGQTYPGVYGRMSWGEPAPTLTTQFYGFGSGRFGHPSQDRAISLREGAILQGFPESYSFVPEGGTVHFKKLGRMIGNAVPVTLGNVIGRSIRAHLRISPMRISRTRKGETRDVAHRSAVA